MLTVEAVKMDNAKNKHKQYCLSNSEGNKTNGDNVKTMTFKLKDGEERLVTSGKCIGHLDERKCLVYSGIDMKTGDLCIISKWALQSKNENNVEFLINLEEEFNDLLNIQHPNLAQYMGIKKDMVEGQEHVYIMREFVNGINCQSLLLGNIVFDVNQIQMIAKAVLSALDCLHRKNVVHKNLNASCVYLSNRGVIKLANYSFDQQLTDFILQPPSSTYDTNSDLHDFGNFILSLIPIEDKEYPEHIHPDLPDFIEKCIKNDLENHRWTAYELLNHPLFCEMSENIMISEEEIEDYSLHEVTFQMQSSTDGQSRIKSEFEEMDPVGEGGFGEVYKARNKIDKKYYAIKKIRFNQKATDGLYKEVQCLSSLNHENVVRYFNAWTEPCSPDDLTSSRSNSHEFTYAGDDYDSDEDTCTSLKSTESENNSIYEWLYIQMEFCEKNTLKTEIDTGLYVDTERIWRFFREILEGLVYIHKQNLIHRDLKPANIFLDGEGRIKIGDFGLVVECKTKEDTFGTMQHSYLTGQIGTAFYTAPEILLKKKVRYNAKVDIYSLGIIFFEMCHKPLPTGMERCKILEKLRTKEIVFPEYFVILDNKKEVELIRWMLNHDVNKRPFASELLESDYIPPPVKEIQKFRTKVKDILNNPQLKEYTYLIESCFKQTTSLLPECLYKYPFSYILTGINRKLYKDARKKIEDIFLLHGADYFETPLLMPKDFGYKDAISSVHLMTNSGRIVTLPHDLRTPFAYFIATRNIVKTRRYSMSRVYKEKINSFDFHPEELRECAFDIVSPRAGKFLNDVEILFIFEEITSSFQELKSQNCYIYLNHTQLLKAILLHFGINEKCNEILAILAEIRGKLSLERMLYDAGLSDGIVRQLERLLSFKGPVDKVTKHLNIITKSKNDMAAKMVKEALKELKITVQKAQALGVKIPMILSLRLIHKNILHYSGMTYHLVVEPRRNLMVKNGFKVLANGGQYEGLIQSFKSLIPNTSSIKKQSAVGISISLNKLIELLSKLPARVKDYALDTNAPIKIKILQELWQNNINCCVIDWNVPNAHKFLTSNYRHLIIIDYTRKKDEVTIFSNINGNCSFEHVHKTEVVDRLHEKINVGHYLVNSFLKLLN